MKRTEKVRQNKTINTKIVHERTKQEREEKHKLRLAPFLIFILLIGLIYLLFFSKAFLIKETKVRGYSSPELIKDIVESRIRGSHLSKNILLFKKDPVIEAIKGDSGVKEVRISKIYPNTILIDVQESKPLILWSSGGEYYEIDDRGYVVGKNKNENIPIVYDYLNIKADLGERVASPTFVNYIIILERDFAKITGSEIEKIIIYDLLTDVRVKSKDSWTAYFNSSKDPISQLENLTRILNEVGSAGRKRLEYIDMRLESRIFYK